VTENKVVVYGKTKPAELPILNSELRQRFIKAFIDQRNLLQLCLVNCGITPKADPSSGEVPNNFFVESCDCNKSC
jgi:hypothetical protein